MEFAGRFRADLKISLRTLLRSPGFAVTAVLVMTLGIGTSISLFTIMRSVLFKPLSLNEPKRLIALYDGGEAGRTSFGPVAPGDFYEWQRESHGFEQMALWNRSAFRASGDDRSLPEYIDSGIATGNFFSTLGITPALGRLFVPEDDRHGAHLTTILSWSFFQRRFHGDMTIVGRNMRLDDDSYTIIGVLPQSSITQIRQSMFGYPFRLRNRQRRCRLTAIMVFK